MNTPTPDLDPDAELSLPQKVQLVLLEEYQNRKDLLDVDLHELETFFLQRHCFDCQSFFLLRMVQICKLIQEIVQFQSEIHKDEHH